MLTHPFVRPPSLMQIRLEIPANILCYLKYHYIIASAVLKLGFLISIFESTAAVTQTRK